MVRPSRLIPLLLVSSLALALPPEGPIRAPGTEHPVETLARARARRVLALERSPRGAAALFRLHALADQLPDLGLLTRVDQKVARSARANPYTRTQAELLEMVSQKQQGHLARVAQLSRRLGFIRDFYVLGAFDNENKSGCDTDFGPEAHLDLQATLQAKGHPARWRKLSREPLSGYVNLGAALRPRKEAVGYALTFLKADARTETTLALGTSGAFRLWVNGKLIDQGDSYNAPRPDQARVRVPLEAGVNRVLLKVCQEKGPFGFYLRQEGHPVEVVLPDALPDPLTPNPKREAKVLPTLSDAIAKLAAAHPEDGHLLADQAEVLANLHTFDSKDHTARALAEKAAGLLPDDLDAQLLAAQLETDDRNVQHRFLEAAVRAEPESTRAQLALAKFERAQGQPERARKRAADVVKRAPGSAQGLLVLAQALDDLGDWPSSVARIETALRTAPRVPAVVRHAAQASLRLDRPEEALQRLRVAVELRPDDATLASHLAERLADMGKTGDAVHQLRKVLASHPFDNGARLQLAELLCANGKVDQGLARFAEAAALSPDEPSIYEREGKSLLAAGRKEKAIAQFEKALALHPQNPALEEVLRTLQGGKASPGEAWALDVAPLAKEADSYAGEDAVTLADYTYTRVQTSGLSAQFHQMAVKVYTPRGVDAFRSFPIVYSPDRQQVRIVRVRITQPDGSIVESYGDSERNLNEPWTGMYYDTRAKVLSFPALAPGDVLEIEYRLEDTATDNLLSDYWGDLQYLQSTTPKLRFRYFVDMPKGRGLYWNQGELPGLAAKQVKQPDGRTLYEWTEHSVPKVTPEPSMPGWSEVASVLHVSTYQNWDQVARYYWGLVKDQLTPTKEVRETVDRVLQGVDRTDTRAVVAALYDFVVTHTRYVALEFGIHGYKPYRVDQILSRRFGDCKDKASLITAMLGVAGVKADLVLLRMRNLGTLGPTPASLAAFNHAIAYVPSLDLFLDGTAEYHGSNELPDVDHQADALIVERDGHGRFLLTPEGKSSSNVTTLTLDIDLDAKGSATVKGQSKIVGESAPSYRRTYQAVATRKSQFERAWARTFPGLSVTSIEISDTRKLEQNVELKYAMDVPRYAQVVSGGLELFAYGSGRSYTQSLAPLATRKFDLVLSQPWQRKFTFRYHLPQGMAVTQLPGDAHETSAFGSYALHQKVEGDTVVCTGEVTLSTDRVKAKDYQAFRAFLQRMDQAFARKIVLGKGPARSAAASTSAPTAAR